MARNEPRQWIITSLAFLTVPSHTYTQPETGSKPAMPSASVYQEAEAPNSGSQAGGVCDYLGILFLELCWQEPLRIVLLLCSSHLQDCCLGCVCRAETGEREPLAGCFTLPCYECGNCWVSFELQEIYMECVHMGCHSPTNATMAWYGPDSWLIDLIHCLDKQTYETWQAV